jgi:RNA polymerase sigma-70 factor, ECF subfamily
MPHESRPAAGTPTPPPAAGEGLGTESELVGAILRKDRKATAHFVAAYADAIYGYVRHRLAPRADLVDDIVQDVFLAALGGLGSFAGSASLRTWLLGIARHKVEDYYREQLRKPAPFDDGEQNEPPADDPPIDDTIDRERMEARTRAVLNQLPDSYRVALLWRYWEGRSARDIANSIGKTEKAVERLLARARARFRQLWEQPSS